MHGRFLVLLALVAIVACGSSSRTPPPVTRAVPPDQGSSVPTVEFPPEHYEPDLVAPGGGPRPSFPDKVPALQGYSLVQAMPNSQVESLGSPIAMVWPKKAGALPLVLNYPGTVMQITADGARKVLDIQNEVALQGEGGALGMALHPRFADADAPHPYAFIWYNAKGTPKHTQRLARFTWSAAADAFDPASELVLVDQVENSPFHNGGTVAFGHDGFLYFGNGDDETHTVYQRLDGGLFAGIFRIDVDSVGGTVSHPPPRRPDGAVTQGYFIPNDNPFVGVANACEEYFALGLRNPYTFSFDKETGELWVADVGETFEEEIDLIRAGDNGEYPYREGKTVREPTVPKIGTPRPPIHSYTHGLTGDADAVIGGFVYRGKRFPELVGKYIFSSWVTGRVWALDRSADPPKRATLVDSKFGYEPYGFAEDNDGELYLYAAAEPTPEEPTYAHVYMLDRDVSRDTIPTLLSETRIFPDMATLAHHSALVRYELNSPLWSDAASKRRWISVPPGTTATTRPDGYLEFPVGTVIVKQFDMPTAVKEVGRTRHLETRILVVGSKTTYGLTYRWRPDGSDAELVTEAIDDTYDDGATGLTRKWHFPGFGECWACHRSERRVLGVTLGQLTRKTPEVADQFAWLKEKGVLKADLAAPTAMVSPADKTATLEQRATAYLDVNCAPCHHPRAHFEGYWDARYGLPLSERLLVDAQSHNGSLAAAFGLPGDAPLIAAGDPEGSLLYRRIHSVEPVLQMPPLARSTIDEPGAALIAQWIASLQPTKPAEQ